MHGIQMVMHDHHGHSSADFETSLKPFTKQSPITIHHANTIINVKVVRRGEFVLPLHLKLLTHTL